MTRLFLRISLAILVAVAASFVIDTAIFDRAMQREFREHPPAFLDRAAADARREAAAWPDEELEAFAREVSADLAAPTALLDIAGEAVPEGYRADLRRGAAVHALRERSGPTSYIPVRPDRVLRVGPMPGFPRPAPADGARMLAVVLAVVGVTGLAVTRPLLRDLRALEGAAGALAGGDLAARSGVRGGGAVGDLARRFDTMAERIEDLVAQRRELLQAVAHEIRTPVARVRFGVEMASMAGDPAERARRLEGVVDDLEELDELVTELLVFFRYDAANPGLAMQAVAVAPILEDLVERRREEHPDLALSLDVTGDAVVFAHATSFRRAVRNLLLNACRHAASRVHVVAVPRDGHVDVRVDDDGPGVPVDQRERIFEPFTRADPSRDAGTGGSGLGLAIVRRIVDAHGGEVTVGHAALGGAAFVTRWRAAP